MLTLIILSLVAVFLVVVLVQEKIQDVRRDRFNAKYPIIKTSRYDDKNFIATLDTAESNK